MSEQTITMTRRYEIDAGHRVPGHQGKCRRLHGHRYVIEAEVLGPIADDGMILDFGIVKAAMASVLEPYDHMLMLQDTDNVIAYDESSSEAREADVGVVRVPIPPTAEHLARFWGEAIATTIDLAGGGRVRLNSITVHETPNCRARWYRP